MGLLSIDLLLRHRRLQPPHRSAKMSCPVDMFGPLPDEVLCHVLSFLPSREAVQTCRLARRWRHLWRSAPAIRVRGERRKKKK